MELLVDTHEGNSTPVDRGSMDGMMDGTTGRGGPGDGPGSDEPIDLLFLEVAGEPAGDLDPVSPGPSPRDLREEPVAARRILDFPMGGGMMGGGMMGGGGGPGRMMSFTIDGQEFDAERTDQRVRVDAVEEWALTHSSFMDHPVHLHVWPMQVVAEEGRDVSGPRWQDVVNVPAFGQVTVRVAFEDLGGRSVFHCHFLDHEDLGMVGTLEAR